MSVTFNSIKKKKTQKNQKQQQKKPRKLIKGLDRFSTKIFLTVCNFMNTKHFQKKKKRWCNIKEKTNIDQFCISSA